MTSNPVWTRRRFVGMAGAAVGASVVPLAAADRAFAVAMREITRGSERSAIDDKDWADVLGAFDLGGRATMNTANLAPASALSRQALSAFSDSVDADPSFQNRAQFSETRRVTRERLARYLGADPQEIALTRNTTEGNNVVVQGLDLGPGDEVVLSAHNHPSNRESWKVRAEREGFSVLEVPLASPPDGPEALLADLQAATTARTKVIAFSHVTNLGGCRFPATEICSWARERGIFTLIDGAQTCGALHVDLHAIGCDFYSASAHKWPCAPREVGVLYVRRDAQPHLWPSIVGVGYGDEGAPRRFESLGQRDDAAIAAFGHAVLLLDEIGSAKVAARVAALTGFLKEELAKLPTVKLYTPMAADFSGGVVTFHIDRVEPRQAFQWLYDERQIVCAASGVEQGGVRFSPHIYTSMADCERAIAGVHEIVRGI